MSHITPEKIPLGLLGLELGPPELDVSFICCVRENSMSIG